MHPDGPGLKSRSVVGIPNASLNLIEATMGQYSNADRVQSRGGFALYLINDSH